MRAGEMMELVCGLHGAGRVGAGVGVAACCPEACKEAPRTMTAARFLVIMEVMIAKENHRGCSLNVSECQP